MGFFGLSKNGLTLVLGNEGWGSAENHYGLNYGSPCTPYPLNGQSGVWGPGLTLNVNNTLQKAGLTQGQVGVSIPGDMVTEQFKAVCKHHQEILAGKGLTPETWGQQTYDVLFYFHHWLPAGCYNTITRLKNGEKFPDILRDHNCIIYKDKNRSWYDQAKCETKNAERAQQTVEGFAAIVEGKVDPNSPITKIKLYSGSYFPKNLKEYVEALYGGGDFINMENASTGDGTTPGGGGMVVGGGGSNIRGSNYGGRTTKEGNPNTVYQLSSTGDREDVLNLSKSRRDEFEKMRQTIVEQTPNRERTIILSSELYNSSILKTTQRSKQDRSATQIRLKS